jgi:hypothetical protein
MSKRTDEIDFNALLTEWCEEDPPADEWTYELAINVQPRWRDEQK